MDNKEYRYAMRFAMIANEKAISGKIHASHRYAEWAGNHLLNAYADPEEVIERDELVELIESVDDEFLEHIYKVLEGLNVYGFTMNPAYKLIAAELAKREADAAEITLKALFG